MSVATQGKLTKASYLESLAFINIEKDFHTLFKSFIDFIPNIGKSTLAILKPLEKLVAQLNEKVKNKQGELSSDEGKLIENFAIQMQQSKGSIYESDFYSQLIVKLIQSLREKYKKQIILIIDDLDRIDPEHIFRILNIFAVHFDVRPTEAFKNKFDIDKIILTCDIENIKKIFKNRYGSDVDFNGYIDKFYTSEIYYFDNKKAITDQIDSFISSLKINDGEKVIFQTHYRPFFRLLLFSMIMSNTMNLRIIKNWYQRSTRLNLPICVLGNIGLDLHTNYMLEVFAILSKIFHNPNGLLHAFERTNFSPVIDFQNSYRPLGDLILLADHEKHRFIVSNDQLNSYVIDEYNIEYQVHQKFENNWNPRYYVSIKNIFLKETVRQLSELEDAKFHYKNLLLNAYRNFLNGLI